MFSLLILSLIFCQGDSCYCTHKHVPFPELDASTLPVSPVHFDWCDFNRAVTLNHDLSDWLTLAGSVSKSPCSPGEVLLLVYEVIGKISRSEISTMSQLYESSEFATLSATLSLLSAGDIYMSGWSETFSLVGLLHHANPRTEASSCPVTREVDELAGNLLRRHPAIFVDQPLELTVEHGACSVERLVVEVAKATASGAVEVEHLRSKFPTLEYMLSSKLPIFDVLTLLRFPMKVDIDLKRSIDWMPGYVADAALESSSFRISLLPFREILSEYVRFTKQPFCSTHQFRTFMNKLVMTNMSHVNIIEGGPNLGDCGLWAAALFQAKNKTSFVSYVEPLAHAAQQIRTSMVDNSFQGEVFANGLGASSSDFIKVAYLAGRDGQATDIGLHAECRFTNECTVTEVSNVSVDDIWKSNDPLHILKLSMNGAELDSLKGARNLFSTRKICSVFMHQKNLWKGMYYGGERDNTYSATLFEILKDANMTILFYENFDMRRPQPFEVTTVERLDFLIDRPNIITDFVTAFLTYPEGDCEEFLTLADFY